MEIACIIGVERLEQFCASLLNAAGFNADEAQAIAQSLTLSEILGHASHGIIRVRQYIGELTAGTSKSGVNLSILHETPASIHAEAQGGVGQAMMPKLLALMVDKLKTQAVVTAALRNCGHIGRIGEWVEIPARLGYVAFLAVNDNGTCFHVAPPGGRTSVTSTNPIAYAFPKGDGEIFGADLSTSAIAFGKVRVAKMNKTLLPPDCIQDADGRPTRDPAAMFGDVHGSILPMGGPQGYKGFALSMFVDMLAAGLSGGQTPPAKDTNAHSNNVSLTLWNPAFFAGAEHMQQQVNKYLDFIRATPPVDPTNPVRLPGDRLNTVRAERMKDGIPLSRQLADGLIELATKYGVASPKEMAAS